MRINLWTKFHPNPDLRRWARARTFAGTSKPHSLYICGFRRKNFYKLMVLLFLVVLAIALAIGLGISKRVQRIRAARNGVVGADGSRRGMILPGSKIFVPTIVRTLTTTTRIGDKTYTLQYEQPNGITLDLSRGSIVPATSYLSINPFTPATFSFGRVITTVEGGSTRISGGTTSVLSPTATITSSGRVVTQGSTTVIGGTTSVSGGRTFTTYTTVPAIVSIPGGASGSEVGASYTPTSAKFLIYNDPGGGVIVVPAETSMPTTTSFITLSDTPTSTLSSPRETSISPSPSPSPSQTRQSQPQPSPSAPRTSSSTGGGGGGGGTIGGGGGGGGGDSGGSGTGQTFSGEATYYAPGLGACGITNTESDLIAAIGEALFDSTGTANSNHNPFCGRQIIVRNKGEFSRRAPQIYGQADGVDSRNNQTTLTKRLRKPISYATAGSYSTNTSS